MAKKPSKLTKKRRTEIESEMWNMLYGVNRGHSPACQEGEDLSMCLGAENWLAWVSGLRIRYAKHSSLEFYFMPHAVEAFLNFDTALEKICELVEIEMNRESETTP